MAMLFQILAILDANLSCRQHEHLILRGAINQDLKINKTRKPCYALKLCFNFMFIPNTCGVR